MTVSLPGTSVAVKGSFLIVEAACFADENPGPFALNLDTKQGSMFLRTLVT